MDAIKETLRTLAVNISKGHELAQPDIELLATAASSPLFQRELNGVVVAILGRFHGASHGAAMIGDHGVMLDTLLRIETTCSALASALKSSSGD